MISTLALLATIVGMAYGQTEEPGERRAFPDGAALEVSLERTTFEVREPVIARVTLTNRGDEPFRLNVRDDGAPLRVTFQVAPLNASYSNHSLWLERNGPEPKRIELAPGEFTTGDILLLLDYEKGYVFASPGCYSVRCRWFGKIYSDELRVTVVRSSRVNEDFLDQLELVALRYHVGESADSLDLSAPEAKKVLDREGALLLGQIISQNKPHLVDPQRNPADKRQADLVEALTGLLDRHPDSSYSGYVARFLGLVHLKTFEHEGSYRGAGSWGETKASPDHKDVTQLCQSEYEKALRYLTIASQADLWPRTTAALHLARLHGMAEEWAEVSTFCDRLRTDYAEQNGGVLADKLENEMRKYRKRIAHRKEADQSSDGD